MTQIHIDRQKLGEFCRLHKLKPRSSIRRTNAASVSVGYEASNTGDSDGLGRKRSRSWNVSTQTTQQPGRENRSTERFRGVRDS